MGTTWMKRAPLAGLLLALGLALAGCGSGPSVRQHKTFHVEGASKVQRVLFFYQEVVLQQKTTYRRGTGDVSVSANATGLGEFGPTLVKRSAEAFGRAGMTVEHASVVPVDEWRYRAGVVFGQFGDERLNGATVIIVKPVGGYTSANRQSATIGMTFEVRAVDAGTKKVTWIGAIDTSTWTGRDFVMRNVKGRTLDEAYADEFIAALIAALKAAGHG